MTDPKTILVAGARGVIGQHLVARASDRGMNVRVLTRSKPEARKDINVFNWDPPKAAAGDDEAVDTVVKALDGADMLVNLAGHPVADGRLNDEHRKKVLQSRVDSTKALVNAQARCEDPAQVWINASAVGFYGDRGEEDLDEDSPQGGGFLAAVCERWEEAARQADTERCRLIIARFGVVLADDSPAWEKLIAPIKYWVGGPLGTGKQWWSWIDADDAARALLHIHDTPEIEGVFNITTPHPVRQGDLVREIATVMHRPAFFPVPPSILRLVPGSVADELLLPSSRVLPRRLQEIGFSWDSPHIGRQLLELLEKA